MARRSLAAIVGLIGGILIFIGGLVGFLTAATTSVGAGSATSLLGALLGFSVTAALGLLVAWVCRPRWWWWPGRRLWNAVLLVGLGVVTWFLASASVLTLIGSVLAIVAGFLLLLEGIIAAHLRPRGLFHRRLF